VYFLGGRVGLEFFGLLHPSASAVWPPTGVAIAALLTFGRGVAPAVFVGAFLVNYTTAGTLVGSLGIAAGNTLEGLAAAYLVTRFAYGREAFDHALDTFKFAALAAIASTTLSATIGVSVLALEDPAVRAQLGAIWLTWWLGDATGAMLFTPLLIAWQRNRPLRAPPATRAVEGALLLATVVAITATLFFSPLLGRYPLAYLCLPPLVWAAFRFRQREVATAVVLMSVVATWATAMGKGPFVMATPNESLLVLSHSPR
jgi:integral membrane sensor domain MASE1